MENMSPKPKEVHTSPQKHQEVRKEADMLYKYSLLFLKDNFPIWRLICICLGKNSKCAK